MLSARHTQTVLDEGKGRERMERQPDLQLRRAHTNVKL